jgi:hypothetical protein
MRARVIISAFAALTVHAQFDGGTGDFDPMAAMSSGTVAPNADPMAMMMGGGGETVSLDPASCRGHFRFSYAPRAAAVDA